MISNPSGRQGQKLLRRCGMSQPIRPERAEAPSPGHRPGLVMFANLSPCKGKSFKEPDDYKAFALTGRIADCHYPQGDALG